MSYLLREKNEQFHLEIDNSPDRSTEGEKSW